MPHYNVILHALHDLVNSYSIIVIYMSITYTYLFISVYHYTHHRFVKSIDLTNFINAFKWSLTIISCVIGQSPPFFISCILNLSVFYNLK